MTRDNYQLNDIYGGVETQALCHGQLNRNLQLDRYSSFQPFRSEVEEPVTHCTTTSSCDFSRTSVGSDVHFHSGHGTFIVRLSDPMGNVRCNQYELYGGPKCAS